MIIRAGMATHAARLPHIRPALESVLSQVDELHVYLNGYTHVPDGVPLDRRLWWHHGRDFGASAKLAFASGADVYLMLDDDGVIAHDYVRRSLAALERRPDVWWTWHGAILSAPYTTYRRSRRTIAASAACHEDTRLHVPGSGVSFFRPAAVPVDVLAGMRPIQHDAVLGCWCHEHGIEVWTPERPHPVVTWGRASSIASITHATSRDPEPIDRVIREHRLWEVEL